MGHAATTRREGMAPVVEFSDSKGLARWLKGKPREWVVVIAARVALRVVPLLANSLGPRSGGGAKSRRNRILPTFRAIAAPWVVGTWPTRGAEVSKAVDAASAYASAFVHPDADDAAALAVAAADTAALVVIAAAAAAAAARYPFLNSAHLRATEAAEVSYAAARAADAIALHIWAAVSVDATALEDGVEKPGPLALKELWPSDVPAWATNNWLKLKRALLKSGENWEVWTDWYEARHDGVAIAGFPNEALELARVQVANEIWQQGPKVVNAHIKRLIGANERIESIESTTPTVPAQHRAAVEPIWRNGQLTVPTQPIAVDLQQSEFPTALRALRTGLQKFADDLDGEANIDRRFVAYLRHLAGQIPDSIPPQYELFELGHAEEVFLSYAANVNEQWPEFLAARYHAMVRQHDSTMRQAPAWREFKRNALRDTITPEQVSEAAPIAADISAALRDDEARVFIDAPLPAAMDALAEPLRRPPPNDAPEWRHAIEAGNELLALDVIESINNTLKRIAEVAVATGATLAQAAGTFGGKFKDGLLEASAEEGHKYGKRMIKWLCAGAATGASIGLQKLILTYPDAFGWLGAVINFLSRLHLPI